MKVIVLCGVCGCGKSFVANSLINTLKNKNFKNIYFLEGDNFHSNENKLKMSNGIALNDEDRKPWLFSIHNKVMSLSNTIDNNLNNNCENVTNNYNKDETIVIISCSALTLTYRLWLVFGVDNFENNYLNCNDNCKNNFKDVVEWYFIHLNVKKEELQKRLMERNNHFMNPNLLDSQLNTLDLTPFENSLQKGILFENYYCKAILESVDNSMERKEEEIMEDITTISKIN
ncbi:hypothetical protein ABK040_009462 [Willaertia magna]